jgi:hypothetical protein
MAGRYPRRQPLRRPVEPPPPEPPPAPELEKQILRFVELGSPPEMAALACGVPEATFRGWLRRATEGSHAHERFRQRVASAEAACAAQLAARVHVAGQRDWRADAHLLERRAREHFGRGPTEQAGDKLIQLVVEVLERELGEDDLDRVLAALERALRGEPPTAARGGPGKGDEGDSGPAAPAD